MAEAFGIGAPLKLAQRPQLFATNGMSARLPILHSIRTCKVAALKSNCSISGRKSLKLASHADGNQSGLRGVPVTMSIVMCGTRKWKFDSKRRQLASAHEQFWPHPT